MFSSCFNCPYKTTIARPKGNFTSPLVFIVGQCPGREEVRQGVVFVGPSGKLLDKLLAENKIPQDIIYFTNAIKCYHDTDEITAKMLKQCKPLLLKEIKEKKPKFIVALGGVAVKALLGNVKLTSVLNQPQDAEIEGVKVKILPTYHPAHALRNPAYLPDLKTTFKLLKSLLDNVEVKLPEIVCLESETDFKKATLELQGTVVGTDFETNHTEIFRANFSPVSVALATRDKIYFIRFDSLRKMMLAKDLFLAPKVHIFHDYLFDGLVLKKVWGIHALKYEDTMLLSYLIDENRPKGLKYLASVYLNLWYGSEMKKKFKAKEDITQIDEDELAVYNATDAFATLLLYPKLWNELKEFQKPLYRMLKKFQKICAEMTYNGFPVDIAYIEELKLKFRQKEEELIKKLNSMKSLKKARKISWAISQGLIDRKKFLSSLEYDKEVLKTAKEQDLSPFKISDILAVFVAKRKKPQSKTPKGDLSTSEKELAKHDDEEFKLILEIRKLHKLYSTYLKGLSEKVCEDGRIHARFSVVGTATGRLASSAVNLQNIARDTTIKNIFVAPSGYKIVQYDWSQIELRIAAGLSGESRMIEAYKQKADLHKVSASRIFKKPIEKITKEERQIAKKLSFSLLYGTTEIGLANEFKITPQEARQLIDKFYEGYPTLHKWEQNIIKEVKRKGYVISPFGRIRRLPEVFSTDGAKVAEAFRKAVNSPVQSTASDINLIFLYEILKQYFPPEVYLVASVHDSGVFLVKDSLVEEFVKFLYDKVETFQHQFKFLNGVPLAIEVSVGEKWGELKEVSV